MFIIDFRNKLVSDYRFSVIGNSNVDKVDLVSHFIQYADGYSIYLKVRSEEENYVDKIAIASEDISVDEDVLVCRWTMGAVSTQCKKLYLQLQFEKDEDIIAQSRIVSVVLGDTINVDELIPVVYPQILKEIQNQIDTLNGEVLKSGSLTYTNDTLSLLLSNKNSETLVSLQVAIETSTSLVGGSLENNVLTLNRRSGLNPITIDLSSLIVDISTKVDKSNFPNIVYGTDSVGGQTEYPIEDESVGKIARRAKSGQLKVPLTPISDDDATSKAYVDGLVNTKIVAILSVADMQNKITFDNIIQPIFDGKEVVIVADLGLAQNPPSPVGMLAYFKSVFVNPSLVIFSQVLPPVDYPLDPTIVNQIIVSYDDVEETITGFQTISYNLLDESQTANRMMAKEFESGTSYYAGDVVAFNGFIYQCTADNAGIDIPSSSDDWVQTTIAEAVLGLLNVGV